MKKLLRFLFTNFQIINFLLASAIIVVIAYWYLPQTRSIASLEDNNQVTLNNPTPTDSLAEKNTPLDTPTTEEENTATNTDSNSSDVEPVNDNIIGPPLPQPEPVTTTPKVETYLGHFPFSETAPNRLVNMGKYYDRVEYLDIEAAEVFKKMKADAQKQNIELVLISGFRDVDVQKQLFTRQTKRQGSKKAAAKLSAPPGYSEHHTGYAVDIGDGKKPKMDLKFEFESTPAYKWLAQNAQDYGFELSFIPNNSQGVSFEPWHWRYIGTTKAKVVFAAPRSLSTVNK